MTTVVFVRRFLTDYARNPVNLLLLAVVPVVFVVVVAGSLADFAKVIGGTGPAVQTVTAAWAAAFLAGRWTDRHPAAPAPAPAPSTLTCDKMRACHWLERRCSSPEPVEGSAGPSLCGRRAMAPTSR